MAIWKKTSAKSGGTKKSSPAAKKRATEKKVPATKKAPGAKTAAKAPPAKPLPKTSAKPVAAAKRAAAPKPTAAAKTPAKEKTTSAPTHTPPRPTAKAGKTKPGRAVIVKAGTPVASKLGTKWSCFRCSAKFYDLNKPEPLCPKCGADQRERPKVAPPPPPAPEKRKQPRPMAPLLEDEDDGSVRYDEDIDLGVRAEIDEPDDDIFQPGEFDDEDVFGGPEDE